MGGIDFSKWEQTSPEENRREKYPILDIYGEDTPIDFLFTLNGAAFMARGNLQTVKGREKTGKSAFGIALITAALGGEFAGVKPCKDGLKVLWIDTEQDTATLRQRAKAALSMANKEGETPEALTIVPLRGFEASNRAEAVTAAMNSEKPDFVFIDGAVDLCADFNDNKESAATVAALMEQAERCKCALLAVIHTNKKDDEARGHLGTILQQKSSEVYELTRLGDRATVRQKLCRFAGIPDITFRFADDFKLQPTGGGVSEAAAKMEKLKHVFGEVCAGRGEWKYTELVQKYMEMEGVSQRSAKDAISTARKAEILFRNEDGKGVVYTYLFPKETDCTDNI